MAYNSAVGRHHQLLSRRFRRSDLSLAPAEAGAPLPTCSRRSSPRRPTAFELHTACNTGDGTASGLPNGNPALNFASSRPLLFQRPLRPTSTRAKPSTNPKQRAPRSRSIRGLERRPLWVFVTDDTGHSCISSDRDAGRRCGARSRCPRKFAVTHLSPLGATENQRNHQPAAVAQQGHFGRPRESHPDGKGRSSARCKSPR